MAYLETRMTPEVIIALLGSPLLVAVPTLYLKHKDAQHKRKVETQDSAMTRLEVENVRLSKQIREAEAKIEELEFQEDLHREEINKLRDKVAHMRRRLIELGLSEAVAEDG